ncbi:MAG: hypothetical protein UY07_C0034G0006 [Parcubacteria group bacterium GW2011_GWA1_47_8]|nr:MAG: hypothetical protein UY07_C0034G0006 [Parcubacteria group bacterium GW2011_GWA1_47_8]
MPSFKLKNPPRVQQHGGLGQGGAFMGTEGSAHEEAIFPQGFKYFLRFILTSLSLKY